MVQYDPEVIQRFAAQLYRRAASIVALYALIGVLGGLASGYVLGTFLSVRELGLISWTCVIVGLVLGVVIGQERAFSFKLEAQKLLCQVQIEANTSERRRASGQRVLEPPAVDGGPPPVPPHS